MFKIQIPKPCHEDWNAMTPTQQGAFCTACSKEVVDFTKMTDEEVQHYFLKNATGKTCGRFKAEQVDSIRIYLPENILLQRVAGWKKFMAVLLLAFGTMLFGCDVATQHNSLAKADTAQAKQPLTSDTSVIQKDTIPTLVGEAAPVTLGAPRAIATDTVCSTMPGQSAQQATGTKAPLLMGRPLLQPDTKKPASDTSR